MKYRLEVGMVLVGAIALLGVKLAWATSVPLAPLLVEGEAKYGATHVLELNYSDFSGYSGSNVTAVNTNTIVLGTTVIFRGMRLEAPFNSSLSSVDATAIYCGIPSDTDRFLTSTTIASDGTEVWTSQGNAWLLEQGAYGIGGTNTITNLVDTAWYVSTTTSNLLTTLRDNSTGCLGTNVAGRVKLYFKLIQP